MAVLSPSVNNKLQRTTPPRKPADWASALLKAISAGKSQVRFAKGDVVYTQGQHANAVYFVMLGKVRLTVISKAGKEATLGTLAAGGFFGEGCIAGQRRRVGTATAVTAASVIRVQKAAMIQALHDQHPLSETFLAKLLARNIAFEEDICGQLFNQSEKRLARALLKLARFGQEPGKTGGYVVTPKISPEALAEVVGTTPSRINFFMNKFRRLGLIEDKGGVRIHPALLTDVVLGD